MGTVNISSGPILCDFGQQPPLIGCTVCGKWDELQLPKTIEQLETTIAFVLMEHENCSSAQ